jgi:hypothetical protein
MTPADSRLMALVAMWRRPMEPPPYGPFDNGLLFARHRCADELQSAIAAWQGREGVVTVAQFDAAVKILDAALPGLNVNKHRIALDILGVPPVTPPAAAPARLSLPHAFDILDEAERDETGNPAVRRTPGCPPCEANWPHVQCQSAPARQPDAADLANRLERVLDERDALREAAQAAYALFGSLDFLTPHEREVKAALAAALEPAGADNLTDGSSPRAVESKDSAPNPKPGSAASNAPLTAALSAAPSTTCQVCEMYEATEHLTAKRLSFSVCRQCVPVLRTELKILAKELAEEAASRPKKVRP